MAAKHLHKKVQDAKHAIAPPYVDHLGNESHMFDYAETGSNTVPHYVWDVVAILERVGYPADRLFEGVLEIVDRVIAYRAASVEMCANIAFRLRNRDIEEMEDLLIERHEFPDTYLGRALLELHEAIERDEDLKVLRIKDSLMLLQFAISDWEHDHEWGQRLANAVVETITPRSEDTRSTAVATPAPKEQP